MCFNFMAAINISSDFGSQKNKVSTVSTVSPSICHEVMGLDAMILVLWMLTFKQTFSLSSFTFIKRLFSSSSCSAIRKKEKKESEVAQSCPTLCDPMDCTLPGSSIHGIFQARILEWIAISFPRRSSQPRGWTQASCIVGRYFTVWGTREVFLVNKAEVNVFLKLSCFFYDPVDVGNLISDSSAFSKSSLNIWKFSVHVLLKPSLKNFEHYPDSIWNEHSTVWTFFGNAFLWDSNENWHFPALWPLLSFPNLLAY